MAKLNPGGNSLMYLTFYDGPEDDVANGIAVDASGAVYVTGGVCSGVDTGCTAVFYSLDEEGGNWRQFPTSIGYSAGLGLGVGNDIAVDAAGNVYVVGESHEAEADQPSDFPALSALQRTYGGGARDAFVLKFNMRSSSFVYSTFLGGTGGRFRQRYRLGRRRRCLLDRGYKFPRVPH